MRVNSSIAILGAMLLAAVGLAWADLTEDQVGLGTSDVIRLKGYQAEDHFVPVSGGWVLNLVRARNPLIKEDQLKNKKAILMAHGINSNANCFISNSVGVGPKDLTGLNVSSMSLEELKEKLAHEPSSKSLPFLALNLGYDVWLLNRRGTPQSREHLDTAKQPVKGPTDLLQEAAAKLLPKLVDHSFSEDELTHINPSSFIEGIKTIFDPSIYPKRLLEMDNPAFWNFSMDDQANTDLPEIIEYILEETDRDQLAYVGHSLGGALPLMMLSAKPQVSKHLSDVHLWAPALDLGDTVENNLFVKATLALRPLLEKIPTQNPPGGLDNLLRWIIRVFCRPELTRKTICTKAMDMIGGDSGGQNDLYVAVYESLNSCGSHELSSLLQSNIRGKMHFFDWGAKRNLIAYGQEEPPEYDISKINCKLDIWAGNSDNVVTPRDTKSIVDRLTVKPNVHFINGKGILFNHFAFVNHLNVSELLIIPTMKALSREPSGNEVED